MKYFNTNFYDPKKKIPKLVMSNNSLSLYVKEEEEKNTSKNLKMNNTFFIFSRVDNNITVASSIDELNSSFELPDYLKEIIKVVRNKL